MEPGGPKNVVLSSSTNIGFFTMLKQNIRRYMRLWYLSHRRAALPRTSPLDRALSAPHQIGGSRKH